MNALRTPDERFADWPGYGLTPHFLEHRAWACATFKAGVRRFPNLVPDAPGAALSRRARDWWGAEWSGQTFMAVGMKDPVLGPPAMRLLRSQIRNCPAPLELAEAGHFVQEAGAVIVEAAQHAFGRAAAGV